MAETTSSGIGATVPSQATRTPPEATAWGGLLVFAAVMMVIVGSFHFIEGLVAIFKDEYYLVTDKGLTVSVDYTAWGWTHLIGGVIVAAAGVGVFLGQTWARVVGVIVALASAILNFAFLAAYPFWSSIIIAMDAFIIYALCVHGREMKSL